ncbi:MAG: hypothetical protein IJR87_03005 [Bacteroidaceae bacterium]|nr:hypothetical protein [Bacteroidaceae bacterium]
MATNLLTFLQKQARRAYIHPHPARFCPIFIIFAVKFKPFTIERSSIYNLQLSIVKAAIKRGQSQARLSFAEREQART